MHDILWKHHQAYTWRYCADRFGIRLPFLKFGWKIHEKIMVLVWYTCPQLLECLRKYDKSEYETDNDETIHEKIIALKLHLPSRWNNHPKKLYCSLQSKLQWRSVRCRPWIFLENTEWQNVSIDSSNWEGLSEFSGMDISSDGPDWELWSILL